MSWLFETDNSVVPVLTLGFQNPLHRTVALPFSGVSNVIVSIPNPNGEIVDYRIVEASTFEPSLQTKFPEIRSFAGQGVMIDVTMEAITSITNKAQWILQKKVAYAPIVATPTGPAKAEIRLFCFYDTIQNGFPF